MLTVIDISNNMTRIMNFSQSINYIFNIYACNKM